MTEPDRDINERERDHWDHHVPPLKEALDIYRWGPAGNDALMIGALGDIRGKSVLDVACGPAVSTAWLAARGAKAVGIDLSPVSIRRGQEVLDALGLDAELVIGDFSEGSLGGRTFDAMIGRFALHHLDLDSAIPALADLLVPNGVGAFLETMVTNPVLRFVRSNLVGRVIPRSGTTDEHPLTFADLDQMRATFGELEVRVDEPWMFRLFGRQALKNRSRRIALLSDKLDDRVVGRVLPMHWSYHQVVIVRKVA
jgi:SAM-dependent methyltransferase